MRRRKRNMRKDMLIQQNGTGVQLKIRLDGESNPPGTVQTTKIGTY